MHAAMTPTDPTLGMIVGSTLAAAPLLFLRVPNMIVVAASISQAATRDSTIVCPILRAATGSTTPILTVPPDATLVVLLRRAITITTGAATGTIPLALRLTTM